MMLMTSEPIFTHFWEWLKQTGPDIVVVVIVAIIMHRLLHSFVSRLIQHSIKPRRFANKRDQELRERTLLSLSNSVVKIIVWIIAGLIIFNRLFPQINLAALGASAGILGVVVGFGAQSLIKDFAAGIFILLEDQYRVGDVIRVDAASVISGSVEAISLRITVLRDMDGTLHYIPNGTINIASNLTKDYANLNLKVGVGYDADIDVVEKIINKIGTDMSEDSKWTKFILETPKFLRVDSFDDSSVGIKILGKVTPSHQWDVAGEFRRRLKKAFDANGIDIPLPQRVVHTYKPPKD